LNWQKMQEFFKWFFNERRELIVRMAEGRLTQRDTLVGFTRHTPAIVSSGPAGLNASIKGVGIVHKEEFLPDTVEKIESYLREHPRPAPRTSSDFLLREIYVPEKVDPKRISTIELALRHTYQNLRNGGPATLLFYEPPSVTYELRCRAECFHDGPLFMFVNGVHDVFHGLRRDWSRTPVYIFTVEEIYDNHPDKMGERIYP
jgi:hypothetical protein